jgi:hypothetical protein
MAVAVRLHFNMNTTPTPTGNYQVFPYFTGTDNACTNAVYFLPPSFTYNNPITFTVTLLYIGGTDFQQYTYGNDDFKFSLIQQGVGAPSQANISVQIVLTGLNMWKCAQSARQLLMNNFVDFLQNIETKFELTQVLIPSATSRISQAIADRMPSPLLESLFYRYSFSPGFAMGSAPYVDIRPGMQLRLEMQGSQFLSPGDSMNGYLSNGLLSYYMNTVPGPAGTRLLVFDPFLGTLRAPTVTDATTSPVVAGGLLDLMPTAGQRSYARLFYPQTVQGPFDPGDQSTTDNATIVSAQTLAQLNAATGTYPDYTASGSPANINTIFLGRATIIPEIPIWITARNQTVINYVPVGTTIANIVERYAPIPLQVGQQVVSVMRSTTAANGPPASINLYTQGLLAVPSTMYDVPLIAGDGVTLNV